MKQLQWHEPAAYRRALYYEKERREPFNSLKFAGAAFLIILGLRFMAGMGSDTHPPPWWPHSVAVAVGTAIAAAYGMPALLLLLPGSLVILSDKGVNNNVLIGRGVSIQFWSWERIAYVSAYSTTVGGKPYEVISLHGQAGERLITLALAGKPTQQEVEAYLAAHGKRVMYDPT